MKINIEVVPVPMCSEFTMFADVDRDLLAKTKTVRVSSYKPTKTRVSTSMQIGQARNGINFEVEGFKQFKKESYSYATYTKQTSFLYVTSKVQNFEVYKKYVTELVIIAILKLNIVLDEITIEVEQW